MDLTLAETVEAVFHIQTLRGLYAELADDLMHGTLDEETDKRRWLWARVEAEQRALDELRARTRL
jgi:hypothetical protein